MEFKESLEHLLKCHFPGHSSLEVDLGIVGENTRQSASLTRASEIVGQVVHKVH
jgi:hypothetical protein